MSELLSSAVGGSKVSAPRGGGRRRQQAPAPSSSSNKAAATPSSIASVEPIAAAPPPTPPPTQPPQPAEPPTPPPTQPSQVTIASTPPPTQASPVTAPRASEDRPPTAQPHEPIADVRASPATQQQAAPAQSDDATLPENVTTIDITPVHAEQEQRAPQPAETRKRPREVAPESQPVKRAKKSSARSNARVQATVNEEDTAEASSATAPASATATRTTTGQDGRGEVAATLPAGPKEGSAPKRRAPKRKPRIALSSATVTEEDGDHANADDAVNTEQGAASEPVIRGGNRAKEKRVKQSRARVQTGNQGGEVEANQEDELESEESDPELHEIDPNTVTMWEVGGDKRHGKTSEREKKMAEIDWAEVARKRREAADRIIANATAPAPSTEAVVETTEGPSGTAEPHAGTTEAAAPPAPANISGVQFRVINGQIVEDESSLTIDRQAQAEADAAQYSGAPIEEEDDLTARINRTTHINDRRREPADRVPMWRRKSDAWNDEDTDRFYDALRMFGTDFFIISKMFPPKTRRQIKAKFIREERLDPKRVNDALLGKQNVPMDLEHYARETGQDMGDYMKYEGIKQAEEVIREGLAEREEELRSTIRDREMEEEAMKKEQAEREKAKKRGQGKRGKAGAGGGPKRPRKKKGEADGGGGEEAVAGAEG